MQTSGVPPQAGLVLDAIASALARFERPDLAGLSADQVQQARSVMFGPQGLTEECLDYLEHAVSGDSHGTVLLQGADPGQFPYLSKEWGAKYLKLSGHDTEQLLIVGNTDPIALFVP
jgi:hypothetical protein